MEVEQMMACLLAEIRTSQEEMREEIKTNQAKMDTSLERMEVKMLLKKRWMPKRAPT
jgi:hypothetical protein